MTVHEVGAEHLYGRLSATPAGMAAVADLHSGLREGRWPQRYVAAIGQVFRVSPRSWPLAQIAAFGAVHAMIVTGTVARVLVGAGEEPARDLERDSNAETLRDLPAPFHAEVNLTQNLADDDGTLSWSAPIEISAADGVLVIPPASVPLEIGTTSPSRTLMHVIDDRGVARWPYGSPDIMLLVNLGPSAGKVLSDRRRLAREEAR